MFGCQPSCDMVYSMVYMSKTSCFMWAVWS